MKGTNTTSGLPSPVFSNDRRLLAILLIIITIITSASDQTRPLKVQVHFPNYLLSPSLSKYRRSLAIVHAGVHAIVEAIVHGVVEAIIDAIIDAMIPVISSTTDRNSTRMNCPYTVCSVSELKNRFFLFFLLLSLATFSIF